MAYVPLIVAGASLLGNVLGGLFSSSSQSSTNSTNLQIARETNAQNKQLFNQQLAFAQDMWEKTNEWNSPQNQMSMLRKAGINPALGSDWQTAAQPGTPSAPSMQGATMQPVDYSWIGNSINTGINAYYQNQLTDASTKKVQHEAASAKVNAELQAYAMKYNLMKIINDAHTSKWLKEQARLSMQLMDRTQEDQVRQASWQTKIQEQTYEETIQRIAESKLRQRAQEIANEFAPKLNEWQLKQFHASVSNLFASARNQDAQAVESHARKCLTDLQASGQKLSNQQQDSIMDALIDEAWSKADEAYWAAQDVAKSFRLGRRLGESYPGNSISDGGKSYTNYNTHSKSRSKGRVIRDKNGNRVYGVGY